LVLDGAGYYLDQNRMLVNAVVTNGTTLQQQAGIVSIGYDTKGKAVDMNVTSPTYIAPLTVIKLQNSLSNPKVSSVKSILYGVKCSTGILATSFRKDTSSTAGMFSMCIQNGSADQAFTVKYTAYDKKGKSLGEIVQNVVIPKYGAQIVYFSIDTVNVYKAYVKVYDSTNKQVKTKGISDLVYSK